MGDWHDHLARAGERYADGLGRLPDEPAERQRQLTRVGNAAGAAALSLLMLGRSEESGEWFRRAAERYRESWEDAPPGSWGRPIGALKARILAGDWDGAGADARWAIEAGAGESDSPIGRYAAALAHGVLGDWTAVRIHAEWARKHEAFPNEVAAALASIATEDAAGYGEAVEGVLESFETREAYLEDISVADTVLVLQALAGRRGMSAELDSDLLP